MTSPIGLDLGARTPEETAVSIAAEIIALRWGGRGERLTELEGPIHHHHRTHTRRPPSSSGRLWRAGRARPRSATEMPSQRDLDPPVPPRRELEPTPDHSA